MNDKSPRLRDYLAHIERAIVRIETYTAGMSAVAFEGSDLTQDAVIRNLEIVGEACRNIERDAPAFAAAHPELPLGPAYEMRNVLSHAYFKVDLAVVWRTLKKDLPTLLATVRRLLDEL